VCVPPQLVCESDFGCEHDVEASGGLGGDERVAEGTAGVHDDTSRRGRRRCVQEH
jgi:hypothetical protein